MLGCSEPDAIATRTVGKGGGTLLQPFNKAIGLIFKKPKKPQKNIKGLNFPSCPYNNLYMCVSENHRGNESIFKESQIITYHIRSLV